ncbi:helix-turn-helix domain-containing protein [Microbacterium luteum]|uniref:helix-turn-helix domain-containing protein n=1 Tax=Microbacterium TaxID=33882 RepID=UPI0008DA07F4|nr:helix-turn-helix domain-containing protein [Microbacterium luteum]
MPASDQPASIDQLIGDRLGRAIREARSERKLSMRALATTAEISQPFLSQIESGQTMPSLITLYRIANALDMSPSALLPADPDPDVVHVSRAADARWVPVSEAPDTAHTRVIHAGVTSLQEYLVRPGERVGDWFESDGEVVHYVIEGSLALEIEGLGVWELSEGDAIAHPGALRNRWQSRGDGSARVALIYTAGS